MDIRRSGLTLLTQALSCVAEKGERYYEAEIYRLKGELLLKAKRGIPPDERTTTKNRPTSAALPVP